MPRVCWEEQLCVSCEFVTINSRCTDFLRSTGTPRGNGEQQIGGTYEVWRLPSTQPRVQNDWLSPSAQEAEGAPRVKLDGLDFQKG